MAPDSYLGDANSKFPRRGIKKTETKTKRYMIPYNTKNIHNLQTKALNITRKARDEIDRRNSGGIKVSFLGAFMI